MGSTSKFLSLVLRHDPARIGIVLDEHGWTDVAALLAACAAHGQLITRAELEQIVATSDKQRFALSEDGTRIRANQGHSVEVDLDLEPAVPPARLYHGTIDRFVGAIRASGLVRGERHHVHLSADVETAKKVGGRRGRPVVLTVRADEMTGHVFYRSANGVWLVEHVPAELIDFPTSHGGGNRSMKVTIAKATLAACDAGFYTNARGERIDLRDAIEAAQRATRTHELGGFAPPAPRTGELAVTAESTIDALVRLAPRGGTLGCLNFASAKNPGGGFLGGAQAQEETLARSSALYPCLCTQRAAFYDRQRASRSAIYLDLAIASPGVPFFRRDDGAWLDAPVLATVITCAAPNASALRQHGRFDAAEVEAALHRRAGLVLDVASDARIDHLVLGAWGAGVFGNDPRAVARAFADTLPRHGFASVTFAVLDAVGANHRAFVEIFG
jgi:putative RNA 2'-phosphotransferase